MTGFTVFLYTVNEGFGFSSEAVQCIKILYQHPAARIQISGSLTDKLELQHLTRQG